MEALKTTAENMRALRQASGFSQEKIADAIGVERSAYSNYELGTRSIPLSALERAADFFGCELSDMYESGIDVSAATVATAFRADNTTSQDMMAITDFRRFVKEYIKMGRMQG